MRVESFGRHPRRHCRLECSLLLAGGEVRSAVISDVSQGGMCLRVALDMRAQFQVGQALRVRVLLFDEWRDLETRVRWTHTGSLLAEHRQFATLGVALFEPEPKLVSDLAAFVEVYLPAVVMLGQCKRSGQNSPFVYEILPATSAAEVAVYVETRDVGVVILCPDVREEDAREVMRWVSAPWASGVPPAVLRLQDGESTGDTWSSGVLLLSANTSDQQLSRQLDYHMAKHETERENLRLKDELLRAMNALNRENDRLREVAQTQTRDGLIARSPNMRSVTSLVAQLSRSDVSVHISGETGAGKELVARALHASSARSGKPFVAQNCAGIPETLLHSLLFGHTRGAFTGAVRDQPGIFQTAHGGTLLLDEVSELSPSMQASLLRALQEREVVPLGATRPVKFDVRVISATHRDLQRDVDKGTFRKDLFFRLVVTEIVVPPLRDRREDIQPLAQQFLDQFSARYGRDAPTLGASAIQLLEGYAWPGNVRELKHEIERALALSTHHEVLEAEFFSKRLSNSPSPDHAEQAGYDEALKRWQRELIERALSKHNRVVAHAASWLRMDQDRLRKLVKRLANDE